MEQKASEFDRIADACRVLGGDAAGECGESEVRKGKERGT
jgi:hypothetical protein